jgi:MFS family permease
VPLGSLDAMILARAFPTIGRGSGDVHLLPSLVTAYLIAPGGDTMFGKIGDNVGRRLILMAAIASYVVGSLICARSPNLPVLIFGRVIHGIGAWAYLRRNGYFANCPVG